MAKEVVRGSAVSHDNSCGVASVILGILSIILASFPGAIMAIIAMGFSVKQKQKSPNKWSRSGMILAIIGLVLSIIMIALSVYLAQNPELIAKLYQY